MARAGSGVGHVDVDDGRPGAVADAALEAALVVLLGVDFEDLLQQAFEFGFQLLVVVLSHDRDSLCRRGNVVDWATGAGSSLLLLVAVPSL